MITTRTSPLILLHTPLTSTNHKVTKNGGDPSGGKSNIPKWVWLIIGIAIATILAFLLRRA